MSTSTCDSCGISCETIKTAVPLNGTIIAYLWLCHPSCGINIWKKFTTYNSLKERIKAHPAMGRPMDEKQS